MNSNVIESVYIVQTNGAFEVLKSEQELQESLDEVSVNLKKGRQVIVEFNQYFITKVRTHLYQSRKIV